MRSLAAFALGLLFAGCATERDDQAFFNTGWVKPQEGADRRLYGVPKSAAPEPGEEEMGKPPVRN